MNKSAMVALLIGVSVLLGAIGLELARDRFRQEPIFKGELRDLVPRQSDLPGWQLSFMPIADTPEMQKQVSEILNYDEAIYAIYRLGEFRVSVYLAYWKPGKVSVRAVARHTPDVCWTLAGWSCTHREGIAALPIGNLTAHDVEHRIFSLNGQFEHVVFWHLVENDVISYHTGWRPPWYAAVSEFCRWGNRFQQEQFFLRISSNRPLGELQKSEVMQRIVRNFPAISNSVR